MISVIIPAHKATKYIDECLASIQGAEILVGVDSCQETLDHLKDHPHIRLFYFEQQVGPFVIKNTLVDEATHDKILFFDADDILVEGVIERIDERLAEIDYLKLNYINFYHKLITKGDMMNDAVIAINRSVFNSLNGFQPWRCGADTELTHRLEHNKFKYRVLDGLAYHRRLHGQNLTLRKDTGHGSPLRKIYVDYINQHNRVNDWPTPPNKTTHSYVTY